MSIVDNIDKIADWVKEKICKGVLLKLPPDYDEENAQDDENYEYKLVEPTVFKLYIPTKDKLLPINNFLTPSVCVRLLHGIDFRDKGNMSVQLLFSTWSAGDHNKDVFHLNKKDNKNYFNLDENSYDRNSEGWRDVWNFVDKTLRTLEESEKIGTLRIMKEKGIEFSPIKEQEAIPDFYPFWFACIEFSVEYNILRNKDFNDLL